MANETHPAKKIYSAHSDAIRIVPLFVAEGVVQPTAEAAKAAPAAPPKLTYRSGPLLTAVEVFTIFWGPAWQQSPQSTMATQINQFFDFILTSPLIDQLAEYSVPGKQIGHGKRTGTSRSQPPELGHSVIRYRHPAHAAAGDFHQPGSVRTRRPIPCTSCIYLPACAWCKVARPPARHFAAITTISLARSSMPSMPYPGCSGCLGGLSGVDALTSTSSHELCEAITDTIPGQGWYDDANGEIGDICAWKTKKVGQYTVQLEWSNKAKKCV